MANVKQMLNNIEAKLRMLEFKGSDTQSIQDKNELRSLERQEKAFSELIDSIHKQKVLIQTAKIEKGENAEDITQWTLEFEGKIAKYEKVMAELHGDVEKLQAKAREEDELKKDDKRGQRFEEELQLEEPKMQMKHNYEKKLMEESKSSKENLSKVNLPKLVITKFQETPLDWLRFWSQFEMEINKAEITTVAKFSYRCMYHRIPHNFLSFIFYDTSIYHGLLLVFWKGFPCSFSSCRVLQLDLAHSSILEA